MKVYEMLAEVVVIRWPEVEAALSVTNEMQLGDVWESSGNDCIANYILILE